MITQDEVIKLVNFASYVSAEITEELAVAIFGEEKYYWKWEKSGYNFHRFYVMLHAPERQKLIDWYNNITNNDGNNRNSSNSKG